MIGAMFAAALLASGPAAAEAVAGGAEPGKAKAEGRGDEMVCRTEQVLGTRFPKKICRTRSAMEADREAERSELNKVRREERVRP